MASSPKKRNELLNIIHTDPSNWQTICREIKFSQFFGAKAKEIRQIELLHIHFVMSKYRQEEELPEMRNSKLLNKFVIQHSEEVRVEKERQVKVEANIQLKTRKVKKLYPYTCPKAPVLKVL